VCPKKKLAKWLVGDMVLVAPPPARKHARHVLCIEEPAGDMKAHLCWEGKQGANAMKVWLRRCRRQQTRNARRTEWPPVLPEREFDPYRADRWSGWREDVKRDKNTGEVPQRCKNRSAKARVPLVNDKMQTGGERMLQNEEMQTGCG